jgi:hypothetical protein
MPLGQFGDDAVAEAPPREDRSGLADNQSGGEANHHDAV